MPEEEPEPIKVPKVKASVHFHPAPEMIPPRQAPDTDEDEPDTNGAPPGDDGEPSIALYDFAADGGDDELPISEGEQLLVIEKDAENEWWKCRNVHGAEGVVPASYVEVCCSDFTLPYRDSSVPRSLPRLIPPLLLEHHHPRK